MGISWDTGLRVQGLGYGSMVIIIESFSPPTINKPAEVALGAIHLHPNSAQHASEKLSPTSSHEQALRSTSAWV